MCDLGELQLWSQAYSISLHWSVVWFSKAVILWTVVLRKSHAAVGVAGTARWEVEEGAVQGAPIGVPTWRRM